MCFEAVVGFDSRCLWNAVFRYFFPLPEQPCKHSSPGHSSASEHCRTKGVMHEKHYMYHAHKNHVWRNKAAFVMQVNRICFGLKTWCVINTNNFLCIQNTMRHACKTSCATTKYYMSCTQDIYRKRELSFTKNNKTCKHINKRINTDCATNRWKYKMMKYCTKRWITKRQITKRWKLHSIESYRMPKWKM